MKRIHLNHPDARRRFPGHPWVYASEIERVDDGVRDGDAVACFDSREKLLGSGLYNSKSTLIWRRYAQGEVDLNRQTLSGLLDHAFSLREACPRSPDTDVRRLVWSDSDSLPGLVVDQYGTWLVIQTLTLGMDLRLDDMASLFRARWPEHRLLLRNDAPVRLKEGMPCHHLALDGNEEPSGQWVKASGVDLWMDWKRGHKTGLYLDQVDQYQRVARHAHGRRVLDTFCNEGGFALACARAGATSVTAVDSSAHALAAATRNAVQNGVQLEILEANVFDFFNQNRSTRWDLIVLDPPPFAPTRKSLEGAIRGYKELNLRAFKSLNNGGILATYSCSHHMGSEMLRSLLSEAARDAGVVARVLETCSQPADHPVLLGFPESEYLRGYILEVMK
ncbi:MAG: class I SAM-dependent rRNA methyltransferase [Candidatus Methylacidiphilales bacterium]